MKKIADSLIFTLFVIFGIQLNAQLKLDTQWVLGYGVESDTSGAGTLLDFSNDTLEVSFLEKLMPMYVANSSISDSLGNLLFYTNGCYVANAEHQLMENGDSLSPGIIQTYYCDGNGHPIGGVLVILPHPEVNNLYYLFQLNNHNTIQPDSLGDVAIPPFSITYSIINFDYNGGLGKVTDKNILLLEDTLSNNGFEAIKHANGKDWWLIMPEHASNCYYKTLLSSSGIEIIDKQCIGTSWGLIDHGGQSNVSLDGNIYARYQTKNGIHLFDFDRCSGTLSNPVYVPFILDPPKLGGVAISPNSRFAYISDLRHIYQFDLEANNIGASQLLVAEYDGFINPPPTQNPTYFHRMQLAPDGKIYIATSNITTYLHTIYSPDSLGVNCDVRQHDVELFSRNIYSIPDFPNYNLGPLASPCDSLVMTLAPREPEPQSIEVYPNPNNGNFTITIDAAIDGKINIYNSLGQLIEQFNVSKQDRDLKIDLGESGLYYIFHTIENRTIATCKVVVVK